jgi:hypothetical protein
MVASESEGYVCGLKPETVGEERCGGGDAWGNMDGEGVF